MTDPNNDCPPEKVDKNKELSNIEKQGLEKQEKEISSQLKDSAKANLKISEFINDNDKSMASFAKVDLQFITSRNFNLSSTDMTQKPSFTSKKSEFIKPGDEPKIQDHHYLIKSFLNSTQISDEHNLSLSELDDLENKRNLLSRAEDSQEAIKRALQLTRLYQEMKYMEELKKARNLILGLDPNNSMGKQLFKELERMHPVDLALSRTSAPVLRNQELSKSKLKSRINAFTGGRVIVIGDLLIDELLEGKPERISREAPVLILEHVSTELIPGGAANTAANLSSLGAICHALGVVGRDEYARKLARLFEKAGISYGLVEDPSRPTTVKTRILSSSHAMRQQLLRMDRISHEKICSEVASKVIERFRSQASSYSAVILSDYRSGLITQEIIEGCMKTALAAGVKVVVDAQDDYSRFHGAALITPNQPDTESAVGYRIDSKEKLEQAGLDMLRLSGAHSVLLTRGAHGMVLFQDRAPMVELPAFNRSEVFDVTGAGDTVVATMTLAMVTGASMVEAMALGNLAAGIVVKKPGTAVTTQKEMIESLDTLSIMD